MDIHIQTETVDLKIMIILHQASVTRMGRWIDFKNDYKTLYPWFMETVW